MSLLYGGRLDGRVYVYVAGYKGECDINISVPIIPSMQQPKTKDVWRRDGATQEYQIAPRFPKHIGRTTELYRMVSIPLSITQPLYYKSTEFAINFYFVFMTMKTRRLSCIIT